VFFVALRVEEQLRVPRHAEEVEQVAYHSIVVPLAERERSEQGMGIACRLAADRGTTVTALTVIEVPVELPLDAHMLEEEGHARRILAEAGAIGDLYGVSVSPRILRGRAAGQVIVAYAHDSAAEIIVLSAPRKQRVARRAPVFGATVDFVLKHAPCRVMVAAAPAQ